MNNQRPNLKIKKVMKQEETTAGANMKK